MIICKGDLKDMPKVGPGTAGKDHILWGWRSAKIENRGKVFPVNNIYIRLVSDKGQTLGAVRLNPGQLF